MKPFVNDNGITIKDLKEFVKDLPEQDENGEDYTVWVGNGNMKSSISKTIFQLNEGDIIIEP